MVFHNSFSETVHMHYWVRPKCVYILFKKPSRVHMYVFKLSTAFVFIVQGLYLHVARVLHFGSI
ncbi:hypothetical protein LguiA_015121 [Lonicera macranthoides]